MLLLLLLPCCPAAANVAVHLEWSVRLKQKSNNLLAADTELHVRGSRSAGAFSATLRWKIHHWMTRLL